MAHKIAVSGRKGGVGKTTVAWPLSLLVKGGRYWSLI